MQIPYALITVVVCAVSVVVLSIRMFRRIRREKRERLAASGVNRVPVESPVREAAAATRAPAPAAAPTVRAYGTTTESPRAASLAATEQTRIFNPLLKRRAVVDTKLPLVEADATPLADDSDLVFGPFTPALASLLPDSDTRREEAKRELQNAGYYQPHALLNLAAIRYLAIIIPMVLMGVLLLVVPPRLERYVVGGLVLFPLIGWALPRLVVKSKAVERTSEIERALPDMLDMLNMCVSQGMTVPASLKRVCEDLPQVHPALAKELQIVTEQARIGTMQHALENFNGRIDVPEVHSFTSLLIQTEAMGTSVSTALAEYSDNMRESLKQRADEKGNQAAFKLLFPTVLCLMPAVYIFLLGPSIIEMSNFLNRDDLSLNQATEVIRGTGRINNNATPQRGRR